MSLKVLFLHPNVPEQFVCLALFIKQQGGQPVFLTRCQDRKIPGVQILAYDYQAKVSEQTHYYIQSVEQQVLEGQAVLKVLQQIRHQGFIPDVIVGHSGAGMLLFVRQVYQEVPFVGYFEWFHQAHGSDMDFIEPVSIDEELRARVRNSGVLHDLINCAAGWTSTFWQHSQFPQEFAAKLRIIHEGIDTAECQVGLRKEVVLPEKVLAFDADNELVTYAARGLEPYWGFPQFMKAVQEVLQLRPRCQVVIVGEDNCYYSKPHSSGKSYREVLCSELAIDLSRVHFVGHLSRQEYLKVLQASKVHVYLTVPFILSRSLLEAMSCGCTLVASDTAPVREVLYDSINAHVVDFFSPQQIAAAIGQALDEPQQSLAMGIRARALVDERYKLQKMLERQWNLLQEVVAK